MKKLIYATVAALGLTGGITGTAQAIPEDGGYVSLHLGYAVVDGTRGVGLNGGPTAALPGYEDLVRTDYGEGMAFELAFGWLIGPIGLEVGISGHGTFDFENGAGYPGGKLRIHPFRFSDDTKDWVADVNLFAGGGYAIGGYKPNVGKSKGWDGWYLDFGLGVGFEVSKKVMIGVEGKVTMPMYTSWIQDWDSSIEFEPTETPSTLVISPNIYVQAYF